MQNKFFSANLFRYFKAVFTLFFTGFLLCSCDEYKWAKTFGSGKGDVAYSIVQTSDGGYAVAGYTISKGAGNFYVLNLNGSGELVWDKTFGGGKGDVAYSIVQTSDGGYAVAGTTESYGTGSADLWILKLNSSGELVWAQTFGGSYGDYATSIVQTSDGGYAVAGTTESYGAGSADFWVLKLDGSGELVWAQTFGGSYGDYATSIVQTSDGGYAVVGTMESYGTGSADFRVIKLDGFGELVWDKTFGGSFGDDATSIVQTSDGGYAVTGTTESKGAGSLDMWVLKLNSSGGLVWDKTFGGSDDDYAASIVQTYDGGYVVAGYTESYGAGSRDFWVLKLNSSGELVWDQTFGGSGRDGANSIVQTSDGGYSVAGTTESKGTSSDFWVLKLDKDGHIK